MDAWGYVYGLRVFLIANIIVSVAITLIRYKYTEETIQSKPSDSHGSKFSLKIISEISGPLRIMILVAMIGSFSSRLVFDFANLYALEVIKISNTQLGCSYNSRNYDGKPIYTKWNVE